MSPVSETEASPYYALGCAEAAIDMARRALKAGTPVVKVLEVLEQTYGELRRLDEVRKASFNARMQALQSGEAA